MVAIRKAQFWLVIFMLMASMASGIRAVYAQTTADPEALYLTTSPLPISLVGKPGESVKADLKVKNGGKKTEILKVGLLKFSAYGEEGKPELKDRETGDDYFDWVHFSESQFSAEPDQWHTVTMMIDLPSDAALGYYYAVTFSRLNPPKSSQTNKLQGGTAILVLLEARVDNARREVKIEEFHAKHRIYEFLPVEFNIKLKNTGTIHLASTGNIFIKRGGKTIGTLEVNPGAGNILPGSKRIFNTSWHDGFPVYEPKQKDGNVELKNGSQVYNLKWDISKLGHLRIGRYTADLVMSYDDGKRDVPLEAVVSFWVIPWRLIFFALVPIIGVSLLVYNYIRLRKRVKKLQDKESK